LFWSAVEVLVTLGRSRMQQKPEQQWRRASSVTAEKKGWGWSKTSSIVFRFVGSVSLGIFVTLELESL